MRTLLSHKEAHSRLSWNTIDLLRRSCFEEAAVPGFQVASVWTYLFFFFFFFFYYLRGKGYGDEGVQPKTSAKTGVESEG
jgi:hypothetical protein